MAAVNMRPPITIRRRSKDIFPTSSSTMRQIKTQRVQYKVLPIAMAAVNNASSVDVRPPITVHRRSKDIFSEFSFDNELQNKYEQGIEALKKEARSMLMAATSAELIRIIDTVERLGLAYHFEREIEDKIEEIYKEGEVEYDLFTTALRFRLLRQHRHHVPCSEFDKFKNKDGKFEEALIGDVEGLLSLYDAAYLQINGEEILEEALTFTTHHLTRIHPQLDDQSPLKHILKRALEYPINREIPFVHAHVFISTYERDDYRDEVLLKLAKLNFNYLQNLYKKELSQLYKWWTKFYVNSNLPYIRDSLAASYFWSLAFFLEPQYSDVRMFFTKWTQIFVVMDDTYDNYATIEEAQQLTEALERWDVDEIDNLPDYMKIVYGFIISEYEDLVGESIKEQMFAIPYFKEEVKQLGRCYNRELKWVRTRQLPPFEEYVKNSEIVSGVKAMFTVSVLLWRSATQETIDWLLSDPALATTTANILRFSNDLGTHERESKGGQVLTALDCYMKQHGASKEETISEFRRLIEDAWKTFNAEWIATTSLPKDVMGWFRNYARTGDFYYKNNKDAYSSAKAVEQCINALLVDPLLISDI